MLRSPEGIHRFLFTSPSRFVGETGSEDYLFTIVFEQPHEHLAGSFLSLTLDVEEVERSIVVPNYAHVAKDLSALLSVFYGKLIEFRGYTENSGVSYWPKFQNQSRRSPQRPPFNSHPRAATQIELNLMLSGPLLNGYLSQRVAPDIVAPIIRASSFYQASLRMFDEDPILSFTLLLSAIEATTPLFEFTDKELLDEGLEKIIATIEKEVKNPEKIIRSIKSRLFQVRRKCSLIVEQMLDQDFFDNRECKESWCSIESDSVGTRVRSAYDLRSLFLHTGQSHGVWVDAEQFSNAEKISGDPVIHDTKMKKLVVSSPTLAGLERIVQYVLCNILHELLLEQQ